MPSVAVKLYSVFFKFLLKHRLQNRTQTPFDDQNPFGVTSRPEESVAAANPTFTDGVATKDIHIDPFTSLSVRIFLPETSLYVSDLDSKSKFRRNSYGATGTTNTLTPTEQSRRSSYGGGETIQLKPENGIYRGYAPLVEIHGQICRKLPVILQFHGGGFVSGSNDSVANDFFCRRIAKLCDVIVISVGYRLAPENRYPAAFEDGVKVLHWLGKQANLAECSKSLGNTRGGGLAGDPKKSDVHRHLADTLGSSMVEPWIGAHADPSRLRYF